MGETISPSLTHTHTHTYTHTHTHTHPSYRSDSLHSRLSRSNHRSLRCSFTSHEKHNKHVTAIWIRLVWLTLHCSGYCSWCHWRSISWHTHTPHTPFISLSYTTRLRAKHYIHLTHCPFSIFLSIFLLWINDFLLLHFTIRFHVSTLELTIKNLS